MLNGLDICAGSGIGSATFEALGLCKTVCYVEWDDYCQRLLQQRMHDGWINDAPIWDDLRTFDGKEWAGKVDFMFGGIPCQPYSNAGKKLGEHDERDLWEEYLRVLCDIRPRFALLENVQGLLSANKRKRFGRILGDLAEAGYDAEWRIISAGELGAPHKRNRLWVLAYPNSSGWEKVSIEAPHRWETSKPERNSWWATEPCVDRVAYGMADGVDRREIIGNGWVPQVAAVIARRMQELL